LGSQTLNKHEDIKREYKKVGKFGSESNAQLVHRVFFLLNLVLTYI